MYRTTVIVLTTIFLWLMWGVANADYLPVDANHPEPCWHERVHAARVCQHRGEHHPKCVAARHDRDLCLAEHADDDPIGGADENQTRRCETVCWENDIGRYCETVCWDT